MAWIVGITQDAARYLNISPTLYHYIFRYDIKIHAIMKGVSSHLGPTEETTVYWSKVRFLGIRRGSKIQGRVADELSRARTAWRPFFPHQKIPNFFWFYAIRALLMGKVFASEYKGTTFPI